MREVMDRCPSSPSPRRAASASIRDPCVCRSATFRSLTMSRGFSATPCVATASGPWRTGLSSVAPSSPVALADGAVVSKVAANIVMMKLRIANPDRVRVNEWETGRWSGGAVRLRSLLQYVAPLIEIHGANALVTA